MIMEGGGVEVAAAGPGFLLAEAAASPAFNLLSFETVLCGVTSCASLPPQHKEPLHQQPLDSLNTPVTTSSDAPSFFGPSTVVEPPHITAGKRLLLI